MACFGAFHACPAAGAALTAPDKVIQESNLLLRTVATRAQRLSVNAADNGEPLVKANAYDQSIMIRPGMPDMQEITGDDIYVRDTVAGMLAVANGKLRAAGFNLIVGYGYRAPSVQEKYWDASIAKVGREHPDWAQQRIEDAADAYAADPRVAGHITGGCVDVTIGRGETPLDMGAEMDDITAPAALIRTFGDKLTAEQMSNRMLLCQVMTEAGFMPFFGEFWHFMYGDREWAFLSGLPTSLYDRVDFSR
jgi:D-alanyl-D-alanine dipeptidase